MRKQVTLMTIVLCFALVLTSCADADAASTKYSNPGQDEIVSNADKASADNIAEINREDASSASRSYTGGWGIVSDEFIEQFVKRYREFESYVVDELEDLNTSYPIHVSIGEEVQATNKLAVSVLSVEPGPYDYEDKTPTVKVTVSLRNLTENPILVKASNFDADNTNSQRVNHKLYVKDAHGNRDERSFLPTRVSPNGTFKGIVYFDGEYLESVIYEPHWLVSGNHLIYFDL